MTTPTNKSSGLLADNSTLISLINESKIKASAEVIPEVDSTQKVLLKREPHSLKSGHALVTHHQTAGIGRLGRSWESAPGDGIMMSVVIRSQDPLLPLFAGVKVCEVLKRVSPQITLKWPNDLVIEPNGVIRKLGGIVIQRHPKDSEIAVLGIGINLKFSGSRPTLEAIALDELTSELPEINQLIFEIIKDICSPIENVIENYKSACSTVGKNVIVQMLNAPDVIGKAIDIDFEGGLVIKTENGQVTVLTGDVKHLRTSE